MLLLRAMRHLLPGLVKRRRLKQLFQLTADAFLTEAPDLTGIPFEDCLRMYAVFTAEHAESYLRSGLPVEAVKGRLYRNSYAFGQDIRKGFRVGTWGAAVVVLEGIYAAIEIDFRCGRKGEVTVSECFFSRYYSVEVCSLISSLDEGLAAGLSGGGELRFTQRITGGESCCRGTFTRGH